MHVAGHYIFFCLQDDDDDDDESDDETMPYSPIDLTDGVRAGSAGVGINAAGGGGGAGVARFDFDFDADRRHSDHLSASSCRRVQTEIMVRGFYAMESLHNSLIL